MSELRDRPVPALYKPTLPRAVLGLPTQLVELCGAYGGARRDPDRPVWRERARGRRWRGTVRSRLAVCGNGPVLHAAGPRGLLLRRGLRLNGVVARSIEEDT